MSIFVIIIKNLIVGDAALNSAGARGHLCLFIPKQAASLRLHKTPQVTNWIPILPLQIQMPDTAVIMARTAAICTPVLNAKSAPVCA
jgi:hypothetical protein